MTSPTPTRPSEAPPLTIRVATPADAAAVRTVLARAYEQYADVLSSELYAAYLADLLDIERRARDATVLVAEADGGIVGTVSLYADGSVAGFGWPDASSRSASRWPEAVARPSSGCTPHPS
jgi:hypothetical protein